MRFRLDLSYCGTHYHGWQRQPNAISIQEILEEAIAKLLRTSVEVVGAGRTDTGVHARYYVAHFDAEEIPSPLPQFVYMLNGVLPHDIAIQQILPTSPDFHARFDAVSRTYEYWIARTKDPFLTERALQISGELSLEKMRAGAALLLEYNDFASFCKTGTDVHTTLCRLTESQWNVRGDLWIYRVTADRFLGWDARKFLSQRFAKSLRLKIADVRVRVYNHKVSTLSISGIESLFLYLRCAK